jgi:hypothetical protein
VRNLINELIETYDRYDEFKRQLESYHNFIKSENGKFAHDVLLLCQTSVVRELLSPRFTKLSPAEKDVQQRTIYQLNQVFDFLMAPMRKVNERHSRKKSLNPKSMGAAIPKSNEEGKKHGR